VRKSKFTNEQMVTAVKQAELGMLVADICRKYGITQRTFYRWQSKGGGSKSEVKRLKELEEENRKRKQLVADRCLDKQILQEVLSKKP